MKLNSILIFIIFICSIASCSKDKKEPIVSKKDVIEFNRLYEAYQLGVANSSQVDSMNAIANKFIKLYDVQNELLLQYHSIIKLPFIKNLLAKELNLDDLEKFHFADINEDTTKFIALYTFKDADRNPESASYFGLKKNNEWHIKKFYRNITLGATLEDAREEYFQTLYKDLRYFDSWSGNTNDDFWNNPIWNDVSD